LDREILENHKTYLDRKKLYQDFGYDMDKERSFIVEQAKPLCGKILEAGTGKGHFALCLAREGRPFITFDISPEEQRFAKLNLAYFGLEKLADFRIENAENTSFETDNFDMIFSVNVLHHLINPYKVMDEFVRVLAPKGRLILADFTEKGFEIMDKIHGMEGHAHETGKVSLQDAELYLVKKRFSIKTAESAHQRVIIAGKSVN
jgi:SAM-dependent methyltransferase